MTYKLYTLDNEFIKETNTHPKCFTGIVYYFYKNKYLSKYWRINGTLHRLDGPAVEHSDGPPEYWFNGKYFSKEQHNILFSIMKLKEML